MKSFDNPSAKANCQSREDVKSCMVNLQMRGEQIGASLNLAKIGELKSVL